MKNKIQFFAPPDEVLVHDTPASATNETAKFFKAFVYAGKGIKTFFSEERNAIVHAVAAIFIIIFGIAFHISPMEWVAVVMCIGIVISFEMLNSALEHLCNLVQPAYHPSVKKIKDIAAAAIFWVSLMSVVVAAIILIPKILNK